MVKGGQIQSRNGETMSGGVGRFFMRSDRGWFANGFVA
jgi:hypothetical protein